LKKDDHIQGNITNYDVVIVGGGLAGLINAFLLSKSGHHVLLIEKKSYPFHRVCGEYISNEVIPFLRSHGLFPAEFNPSKITRFQLTSVNGKVVQLPLDLGGFGISRYALDNFLYNKCLSVGVDFLLNRTVEKIDFQDQIFTVTEKSGQAFRASVVIGAFGKRSSLDRDLDRSFMKQRSPYIGVKYHIKTDFPKDLIALHNFRGGYCGMSHVENDIVNLCYLGKRSHLKEFGTIERLEQQILSENPHLKKVFDEAEFLFDKPLVINEISFATKTPIENHILMSGDAAGMVTPLCGNGMAMAIRSAKLLSEQVDQFLKRKIDRAQMEDQYVQIWKGNFSKRLWAGRKIQWLFGKYNISNLAVNAAGTSSWFSNTLMGQTHGQPFQ
jgi:flavin-dependent dehydrogenase